MISCRFDSIRFDPNQYIKNKIKCGSFRMWREAAEWWQNYEGQSPLEYCIDGAIIEMHQSLRIKEVIDGIQEKVCLEWRHKITPHIVSRSASAHYRRSISNGTIVHHQEWKTKEIQFEKLVIQSIFPIEMILNKYFLENPSSEKHSKYPPSTTPNHRFVQHTHTNAHHGTLPIPSPHRDGTHFISIANCLAFCPWHWHLI